MNFGNFIGQRLHAFKFAWRGIVSFFKKEKPAKIHGIAAVVVIISGLYVKLSPIEWSLISITIALVICLEIINSAIEEMMDLLHPEQNTKVGRIKDLAAGAVLIASLSSLVVALLILVPKFL